MSIAFIGSSSDGSAEFLSLYFLVLGRNHQELKRDRQKMGQKSSLIWTLRLRDPEWKMREITWKGPKGRIFLLN